MEVTGEDATGGMAGRVRVQRGGGVRVQGVGCVGGVRAQWKGRGGGSCLSDGRVVVYEGALLMNT